MKKLFIISALIFTVSILHSCEKVSENSADGGNSNGISHEESQDYLWDESSVADIALEKTFITTSSIGVSVDGSIATITKSGVYRLSGSLSNGQIVVDAGENDLVRLILNNSSITNTTGSAIFIKKSMKTIINLVEGTQNSVIDGSAYALPDEDPNAAIFSKSDLTIFGAGALTVKGNYNDGITSKDGLILKSGTITVAAVDDGIRGKDYLIVKDGTIIVNSGGDGLKSDNQGNKSVGYILIENSTIKVTAGGDGLTAQTTITATGGNLDIKTGGGNSVSVTGDLSAKGLKGLVSVTLAVQNCIINSADDAIHSNEKIVINSGTYSISTADDAIHADNNLTINDGNINITKCYEGLESHSITVNNGNISITSSDDCFNATAGSRTEQDDKSYTYINGGRIALNSQSGDPLDSNGSMVMTGGVVICHGPCSQPNVAIDYNGTFNISGGFVVASGPSSNMFQGFSNTSLQPSIKLVFKSMNAASTIFHIQDSAGNDLVNFKPLKSYLTIVFTSSALKVGSTYTIYKSGSSTGTVLDGLYTGGIYSPGTQVSSFTISGTVTSLSNL